jgi:hypothetical protein
MRLLLASIIALLIVAAPATVEARTKVLQPVYMLKARNTNAAQTEAALRRAFVGRHWTITRDQPGEIEATLVVREHSITVKFAWTATQVSAIYVASENMDYEVDGDKTYIDRYYYRWLKFLQRDIINYSKKLAQGDTSPISNDADDKDDDKDDEPAPAAK